MGKFFCGFCSESHPELIESVSCPECGRKYCVDSIQSSLDVNMYECPYCDCPFEKFPLKGRLMKVFSSMKTKEMEDEVPVEKSMDPKMLNLFKQIIQFLESNEGNIFDSPREKLSRGRRKPMKFIIIETDNSEQRVKIQFKKIQPPKASSETVLPLDYWRFELALNHLEGKNFIPIGGRLVNPPDGSLEYVLQEEDKRIYHNEAATKTAPHIADLLVLAGVAELDKVKSPISGRRVQAIRLKENREKIYFGVKNNATQNTRGIKKI